MIVQNLAAGENPTPSKGQKVFPAFMINFEYTEFLQYKQIVTKKSIV